jgi:hypothetical protein
VPDPDATDRLPLRAGANAAGSSSSSLRRRNDSTRDRLRLA